VGERLRFGVMCSGATFPAWQARCIEDLVAVEGVEPALLIVNAGRPAPAGALEKVRTRWRRGDLAWSLYRRAFVAGRSAGARPVDLGDVLSEVPVMECRTTRRGRFSEEFSAEDVETIRRHELDFVLRFEFGIIRGPILDAARFGLWSFHHGDERRYRGGPPCFWEIVRDDPVTGGVLQRLTDRLDGGVILHRGTFRTIGHSYIRNRDAVYMGSADWPARVCRDIQNGTATYLDAEPSRTEAPVDRNPSVRGLLTFGAKVARNFARAQIRALSAQDRWRVGVIEAPIGSLLGPGPTPDVRWLTAGRRGTYLADPFPIHGSANGAMLAEEYDHRTRRGRIVKVDTAGEVRLVLDPGLHASYPFTFEHDGEVWCTPETVKARRVDLYRGSDGGRVWTRVASLIDDVAAVDPTVFRHDGLWWLFCTDGDRGPNTKLHAWYAADLLGPWSPHGANPLKTDVTSSRPAGTPFVRDGRLYRPAQDASRTYGGRVVINEVLRLTPTEFEEAVVAEIAPDPDGPCPDGVHTISAWGSRTLVDGKRREFAWRGAAYELGARMRAARTRRAR
jgi:hypothetical protein